MGLYSQNIQRNASIEPMQDQTSESSTKVGGQHPTRKVCDHNSPMKRMSNPWIFLSLGALLLAAGFTQQTEKAAEPTSDQVFKNIQVFKGVPASDLIPAMEFMSASLKFECSDCHDPKDFSADTQTKGVARKMILMQRDINAKHFNNRNEVTCMSCHNGNDHPASAPIPTGVVMRHKRMENAPKPEDLFKKHIDAVGKGPKAFTRTGTLTAKNDQTHQVEAKPVEFIQMDGGKFAVISGDRRIQSNGKQYWYSGGEMMGEPAAMFERIGRAWRGDSAFDGLEKPAVSGTDTIGKTNVIVVRASRPATTSTEELYFDAKTGLLLRAVNMRRSTLGTVISAYDYSDFKVVDGVKIPMKVVVSFGGDEKWTMAFKSARADASLSDSLFHP